jgi:cyclopropane fatty-acyl-phospholipid synthase-like methyltransferase
MTPEDFRRVDDARMSIVEERLSNVIENQKKYETEARDWRERFCSKLDKMMEKMDNRPCIRHDALLSNVKAQLGWMWAVTGAVILAIIAEWVQGHGK